MSTIFSVSYLKYIQGNGVYGLSPLSDKDKMSVEILSYSDGKRAIARAASFVCSKYMEDETLMGGTGELIISEADLSDALKALG